MIRSPVVRLEGQTRDKTAAQSPVRTGEKVRTRLSLGERGERERPPV